MFIKLSVICQTRVLAVLKHLLYIQCNGVLLESLIHVALEDIDPKFGQQVAFKPGKVGSKGCGMLDQSAACRKRNCRSDFEKNRIDLSC